MEYSLQELRARKGLVQGEVAQHLGVSLLTYQRYEKNPREMRVKHLFILAELFGVETGEIALRKRVKE